MSSWLPSRARWALGPGVRREDDEGALRQSGPAAGFRLLRALPSFPPRKRGPRNRGGAASTKRASAQWALRRRDARVVLKRKHSPCHGALDGSMSFWLPPSAPWSLGPGVRRENEG